MVSGDHWACASYLTSRCRYVNCTSCSVVAHFGESLLADEFTSSSGDIFYLGGHSGDSANNLIIYGLGSTEDCYVACLEHNNGRCLVYKYGLYHVL